MANTKITGTFWAYCMPMRPAGPGCQPCDGLIAVKDLDPGFVLPGMTTTAWSALLYDRKLTDDEIRQYELLPLCDGEMVREMEAMT